jgi:hypothetical protein
MSTRPGRGRGRGAKSAPPASIEGGANEDRDKGRGTSKGTTITRVEVVGENVYEKPVLYPAAKISSVRPLTDKDFYLLDKQREIRIRIKNSQYNLGRKVQTQVLNTNGNLQIGNINLIPRYFPLELIQQRGVKKRAGRKTKIIVDDVDAENLANQGDAGIFGQTDTEEDEKKDEEEQEDETEGDQLDLDDEDEYQRGYFEDDNDDDGDDGGHEEAYNF